MSLENQEWVTLRTLSWQQEAMIIKSLLESEGILCMVPEEHQASINPVVTGFTIRILVQKKDLEKAQQLLSEREPSQAVDSLSPCPQCGSSEWTTHSSFFKNLSRFLMGLFFFVPMRRASRSVECRSCHHRWQETS